MPCSQIFSRYIDNSVRINIKCYLNLWCSCKCFFYSWQPEVAQKLVIPCKLAFSLKYFYIYWCLEVPCSCKYLAVSCWNCCISLYKPARNSAYSLYRQWKRCNIHKNNLRCRTSGSQLSSKLSALNSRSHCNTLIRIKISWRLYTTYSSDFLLNSRNSCRASD